MKHSRRGMYRKIIPAKQRDYDQVAESVMYWIKRGLCQQSAEIMADARSSYFSPLVKLRSGEPDLDYGTIHHVAKPFRG